MKATSWQVMAGLLLAAGLAGCSTVHTSASASASTTPASGSASVSTAPSTTASITPSLTPKPTHSPADQTAVTAARKIIAALGGIAGTTALVRHDVSATCKTAVQVEAWEFCWDETKLLTRVQNDAASTPVGTAGNLGEAAVDNRGRAILTSLGVKFGDMSQLFLDNGRWTTYWQRIIDGVPVLNGGTRLILGDYGAFVSYEALPLPPAPKPAKVQTLAQATAAFNAHAAQPAPKIILAKLAWWRPSDSADSSLPLRLCWVIYFAGINDPAVAGQMILDAGTGELLDSAAVM